MLPFLDQRNDFLLAVHPAHCELERAFRHEQQAGRALAAPKHHLAALVLVQRRMTREQRDLRVARAAKELRYRDVMLECDAVAIYQHSIVCSIHGHVLPCGKCCAAKRAPS